MADQFLLNIWDLALAELKSSISMPEVAFNLWFGHLTLISLDANTVTFSCSTALNQDVIQKRYSEVMASSLEKVIGFKPAIKIIVANNPDSETEPKQPDSITGTETQITGTKDTITVTDDTSFKKNQEIETISEQTTVSQPGAQNLLPDVVKNYTFDNFIVGDTNTLAHAAAIRVAKQLGSVYNPLFIYGDPGVGKTHLMYAIANEVLKSKPNCNIVFIKGDTFTNELVEAIGSKGVDKNKKFRDKYRSCDILMLDDIQSIAGKDQTQVEFFNTFEALKSENKQIIITSDKPPKEMPYLEARIRSRLESGLIVDIKPPVYEMRLAIISDKAKYMNVTLTEEIQNYIANTIKSNVRSIEGLISNLSLYPEITMDIVQVEIQRFIKNRMTDEDKANLIIETVSQKTKVSLDDIMGASRKLKIQEARNISMYLMREMTKLSLQQIGGKFGRDHSTVHSNISGFESKMKSDTSLSALVNEIKRNIKIDD